MPQGGSSPGDFDARGAAARCVVRDLDSKQFFMFYEVRSHADRASENFGSSGVLVRAHDLGKVEGTPPLWPPLAVQGVAEDGRRSIGLAVSRDGMKDWQRCPQPVLEPSGEPGAWDGGSVGTPWAVSMAEGRWRLYYSGRTSRRGSGWEGIGLALSNAAGGQFEGAPSAFKRRAPKAVAAADEP